MQCDVFDCKFDVWTDHELLEIFVFYVIVFNVLECNDVLLITIDFILRILNNYIVIFVLNFPRLLHFLIKSTLRAQKHLIVMERLFHVVFDNLLFQQFLFDKHTGQDQRVKEVLVGPVFKK